MSTDPCETVSIIPSRPYTHAVYTTDTNNIVRITSARNNIISLLLLSSLLLFASPSLADYVIVRIHTYSTYTRRQSCRGIFPYDKPPENAVCARALSYRKNTGRPPEDLGKTLVLDFCHIVFPGSQSEWYCIKNRSSSWICGAERHTFSNIYWEPIFQIFTFNYFPANYNAQHFFFFQIISKIGLDGTSTNR